MNIEKTKENLIKQKNNPLHNITLKTILETLVEKFGWEKLSEEIKINCFVC